MTQTFSPRPGITLAYNRLAGSAPGILFMGGFRSDMTGTKATWLQAQAGAKGRAFVRFDYTGHGQSSGKLDEGTLSAWLQDSLDVFDRLTEGPQIVVGSSMGGWLALLLALRREERVKGLVLLAPAPDFTKDLLDLMQPEDKALLRQNGVIYRPNTYGSPHPFTRVLFEDAEKHLLLDREIDLHGPVRLIHGKQDADVPWLKSAQIMKRLTDKDAKVIWVDDGDHRLSREQDLKLIGDTVEELAAKA
jgi:pimeloyl-ACP methyl ester carboxylesterase